MVHTLAVFLASPQGILALIGLLALLSLILFVRQGRQSRQYRQHSRPTPCVPVHVPPFTVEVE